MDRGREFVLDSYGMLPELSFFDPIMNNIGLPATNKDEVVKVKMSPVIFLAQNELSKFVCQGMSLPISISSVVALA